MKSLCYFVKIIFLLVFSLPAYSNISQVSLNQDITRIMKPKWPYFAFHAIPQIIDVKPMVSIKISIEEKKIISVECVEIEYHKIRKIFEPKAILERKSLHELLCRAMRSAVQNSEQLINIENFPLREFVCLKFDFYNGLIELAEIPYPPSDPLLTLEDVFVDNDTENSFGGLEFPEETKQEINETPL